MSNLTFVSNVFLYYVYNIKILLKILGHQVLVNIEVFVNIPQVIVGVYVLIVLAYRRTNLLQIAREVC